MQYRYDYAHDSPTEPWSGPYSSQRACRLAGHRDGNGHRVLYVRASVVLGPGSFMEVGVERIDPTLA